MKQSTKGIITLFIFIICFLCGSLGIAEAALNASGQTINAIVGQSFTGTVATFSDSDTTALASDYTATIDWGDGTALSVGTISGSTGNFSVAGTHTYASIGTFVVTVQISKDGLSQATANSTAYVTSTVSIPTMTEWGMIIFVILAGLGAVYYIRRQTRVKNYTAAIK